MTTSSPAPLYDGIASVLGTAVPPTDHALSVSLPTWSDNVGYMKGDKTVLDALLSGYPRFVLPLNVRKLGRICEERFGANGERCLLFPSCKIAEQCRTFLMDHSSRASLSISVRLVPVSACAGVPNCETAGCELHIVLFPEAASQLAKQFWQYTSTGISSRHATHCKLLLAGDPSKVTPHDGAPRTPPVPNGRHHLSTTPTGISNTVSVSDDNTQSLFGGNHAELLEKTECNYVAETCRTATRPLECAADAKRAIRRRIAGFLSLAQDTAISSLSAAPGGSPIRSEHDMQAVMTVAADDVWLFPTGMSAIWHAHHLCMALRPSAKSVCFGFPYVDTYKCLEKWGPAVHLLGGGADEELDDLQRLLEQESQSLRTCSISALFTEFPFNPRLRSPNLPRLRELADKYGFAIVVDDTIGNPVNVQVLQYVDIVVSSLSKIFSGEANVMGGSLAFNPKERCYRKLKTHLVATFQDTWFGADAIQMELNSRNLRERISAIDANALAVSEFLRSRSLSASPTPATPTHGPFAIKEVFYPKWMTRDNYDACRARGPRGEPIGGYGGLLSLTFASLEASRAFYDALPCAKGPSLGTNFTLSCPYTIIAHYQEMEWAASWGVEEGLVRISGGMEKRDTVLQWVEKGLLAAETVVRGSWSSEV